MCAYNKHVMEAFPWSGLPSDSHAHWIIRIFGLQSPRSFWPAAGIESSGLVQHRKSANHGLANRIGCEYGAITPRILRKSGPARALDKVRKQTNSCRQSTVLVQAELVQFQPIKGHLFPLAKAPVGQVAPTSLEMRALRMRMLRNGSRMRFLVISKCLTISFPELRSCWPAVVFRPLCQGERSSGNEIECLVRGRCSSTGN